MLDTLFLRILNMSLTGSFVILLVLLSRALLYKAPKKYVYPVWGLVLLRLCAPFSLESIFSLLPSTEVLPIELLTSANPSDWYIQSGFRTIDQAVNPLLQETSPAAMTNHFSILAWIWLAGTIGMLLYSLISLIRLRWTLIGRVRLQDNIYLADHIHSPFVLGILRPKIYLPSSLNETEQQYILLHEKAHIRHLDPFFRAAAFIMLSFHWFNPLVWAAFWLSGRDMEMACDESVMQQMDTDIRRKYAQTLLQFATGQKITLAAPLAFGESDTKVRIKNVLRYHKPHWWMILAAVILLLALCIGLLTNPIRTDQHSQPFESHFADRTTAVLTFPAYQEGRTDYNDSIYDVEPFSLRIDLPAGWTAALPPAEERDTSASGFTPVYLMEGSEVKATVSFNTFQLYEEEVPLEDFYKVVYAQLRLGSLSRWDTYTPIVSTQTAETALSTVFYKEAVEGVDAASWPEVSVPGILSYDKDRLVYIAIQFADDSLPLEELRSMAKSISLGDA